MLDLKVLRLVNNADDMVVVGVKRGHLNQSESFGVGYFLLPQAHGNPLTVGISMKARRGRMQHEGFLGIDLY